MESTMEEMVMTTPPLAIRKPAHDQRIITLQSCGFALQVIGWQDAGLNNIQLTFKILRLDGHCKRPPAAEAGWGQDLQVDLLMVTHQQEVIQ